MKILWITNSPFPEAFEAVETEPPGTPGWIYSAAQALLNSRLGVELAVASFYEGDVYTKKYAGGITHYLLPLKVREDLEKIRPFWQKVKTDFSPEVVHIHGTEYVHSYSFVKACGSKNVVVSIQGLVSVYERYYFGGIDKKELRKSITLRDIVRFDTVFSQHKYMHRRGRYEKLLIEEIDHVIGRTSWDHDHVLAINPEVNYHFCNENLRSSFYENRWSIDKCEKYSIFISQAYYPIKGFHQLIKALPIVLKQYPKTKVYVAGHDFFSNRGIKIHGFGNYINKLIRRNNLVDKISFTGILTEKEMCQRFLDSHVFVCPSSIENSPNSVGEAQLLGVPCIASYVGGTSDMVTHQESGLLYRFEEIEMLASNICKVFKDNELALRISKNGRDEAAKRHDRLANTKKLCAIYEQIISR